MLNDLKEFIDTAIEGLQQINIELFQEFVELKLERKEIARRDKVLIKRESELTEQILQQFEDMGLVEGIVVSGYNLSPSRQLWASAKDGDFERGCQALRDLGLDDYVAERFDARKVSALVREYDEEGEIPEELTENFTITEKYTISMTKAKEKKGKKK